MIEIADLHWIAGLLEGEGCFLVHRNNKGRSYPRITCGSTDFDVLEELDARTQHGGKIYSSPSEVDLTRHQGRRAKPYYRWQISQTTLALSWMYTLYPLMGQRRRAKIREVVTEALGREPWAMAA